MSKQRTGTRQHSKNLETTTKKSVFRKISNYIFNNHLQIIGILVPTVIAIGIAFWTMSAPDIQIVLYKTINPKVIDKKFDENGNYLIYYSVGVTLKNCSIKSGFVDRAELIPQSLSNIPEFNVLSVEKEKLGWTTQKEIHIKFLVRIPEHQILNADKSKELLLNFLMNLFDNEGKLINKSIDGRRETAQIKFVIHQYFGNTENADFFKIRVH